jgi:NAD(P)-dependent dehydrogenase (short-subunit alcohol dehydrogenase family)
VSAHGDIDPAVSSSALAELFSLRDRIALITGGGGGLGRVFAQTLGAAGAHVIVADRSESDAAETARIIQVAGGSAAPIVVDVADPDSVAAMADEVARQHRHIHVLVNNAGISTPSRLTHEIPLDEWHRVIAINLTGVFLCSRAMLPLLLEAGSASVVNIASIVGVRALDPEILAQAGYVAAKAGVIGLTLQMAVEYGPRGVRVNAIAPGWHLGTALGKNVGNFPTEADQQRLVAALIEHTPLRRTGRPNELGGLMLYLACDASAFLTGQVISHDGGWTAW